MIDDRSLGVFKATTKILQGLAQDLPRWIYSLPPEKQVELGYVLSQLVHFSQQCLELVKSSLRKRAVRYGTLNIKGPENLKGTIHFPKPEVVVRPDVDWGKLKAELGDKFPLFFEATYTPKKGFVEKLEELEDASMLMNSIDFRENKPRVKFEEDSDD